MPKYEKKEAFEVYNVISVKDAFAIVKALSTNRSFNAQTAEDFFIEQGVTVWGLVAPAHRLADKVNEQEIDSVAKKTAREMRAPGRS